MKAYPDTISQLLMLRSSFISWISSFVHA